MSDQKQMSPEELDAYIQNMKVLLEAAIRQRSFTKTAGAGYRTFSFTINEPTPQDSPFAEFWALAIGSHSSH